jgi:hypothetical protein
MDTAWAPFLTTVVASVTAVGLFFGTQRSENRRREQQYKWDVARDEARHTQEFNRLHVQWTYEKKVILKQKFDEQFLRNGIVLYYENFKVLREFFPPVHRDYNETRVELAVEQAKVAAMNLAMLTDARFTCVIDKLKDSILRLHYSESAWDYSDIDSMFYQLESALRGVILCLADYEPNAIKYVANARRDATLQAEFFKFNEVYLNYLRDLAKQVVRKIKQSRDDQEVR